jgi:hypothetical protein
MYPNYSVRNERHYDVDRKTYVTVYMRVNSVGCWCGIRFVANLRIMGAAEPLSLRASYSVRPLLLPEYSLEVASRQFINWQLPTWIEVHYHNKSASAMWQ